MKFSEKGILMSKTDVSDAFENVRVDTGKAHNFCYTVGELVVIGFRFDFRIVEFAGVLGRHIGSGRTRTPQQHDRFSSVVRGSKINDGSHVKVVERWKDGKPTPIPPDAKVITHSGERKF